MSIILPVQPNTKIVTLPNWQRPDLEQPIIPPGANRAQRLDHLTDVDPDCAEAVALAPLFMPPTECRFGRPSGITHYFYALRMRYESFKDEHGDVIIEIRSGAGHYTVVPPSRIPRKDDPTVFDTLAYAGSGEPSAVDGTHLRTMVTYVVAAVMLARHWPDNGPSTPQHFLAQHAAGFLVRRGIAPAAVVQIIKCAAEWRDDENVPDRLQAARDSCTRYESGQPTTGGPELARIIGDPAFAVLDRLFPSNREEKASRSKEEMKALERMRREIRRELDQEQRGPVPVLSTVHGAQLAGFTFPLREALIFREDTAILRAGHIAQTHSDRGLGKTWLNMTLALALSAGGHVLCFRVPVPRRVLYIDGEMASADIQERLVKLSEWLRLPLTDRLVILGADWQEDYMPRLDTPEGQMAVAPLVELAEVIFIDNRSCLFDPEGEKDATAWQPAGEWLLALRKMGKAVMLAHHSNRQGAARGHSKAEDPMDLILKLTRPEDYHADQGARFLVEVVKGRGVYGPAAAPFIAALTPSGWEIEMQQTDSMEARILMLLRQLETLDELPKSINGVISKITGNRQKKQETFAVMVERGDITRDEKGRYKVAPRKGPGDLQF